MPQIEFSKILIDEIIAKRFRVKKIHDLWESCGLDKTNLDDKNEIWKWYAKSTLHWGGVNDNLVHANWKSLRKNSILLDITALVNSISQMSKLTCFVNFTRNCPIEFKNGHFLNEEKCYKGENFNACPMSKITRDLSWHRHHYKTGKIFIESAKRLFILNDAGKLNCNLNDVVSTVFAKYSNSDENRRFYATDDFFNIFENMTHYPAPAKSLLMFISDMSMPFMQVNHWPDFDPLKLIVVDTHVKRLSHRFGIVNTDNQSFNQIKKAFQKVYPENPRALSFAMFLFAGEDEMNICTKTPKCRICKITLSKLFEACPYPDKIY